MKNPKTGLSQNRPKSSKTLTSQSFEVTAPRYSEEWMDEVWTMRLIELREELEQEDAQEREKAQAARQKLIDKMLKDATRP